MLPCHQVEALAISSLLSVDFPLPTYVWTASTHTARPPKYIITYLTSITTVHQYDLVSTTKVHHHVPYVHYYSTSAWPRVHHHGTSTWPCVRPLSQIFCDVRPADRIFSRFCHPQISRLIMAHIFSGPFPAKMTDIIYQLIGLHFLQLGSFIPGVYLAQKSSKPSLDIKLNAIRSERTTMHDVH